jgi:hypothetical protein
MPTTCHAPRRHAGICLTTVVSTAAILSLAISIWLLLFTSVAGVNGLIQRSQGIASVDESNLAQWNCIAKVVDSATTSGDNVHLSIQDSTNGPTLLYQRFVDLEVPRLNLTNRTNDRIISLVRLNSASGNCGTVEVTVGSQK